MISCPYHALHPTIPLLSREKNRLEPSLVAPNNTRENTTCFACPLYAGAHQVAVPLNLTKRLAAISSTIIDLNHIPSPDLTTSQTPSPPSQILPIQTKHPIRPPTPNSRIHACPPPIPNNPLPCSTTLGQHHLSPPPTKVLETTYHSITTRICILRTYTTTALPSLPPSPARPTAYQQFHSKPTCT